MVWRSGVLVSAAPEIFYAEDYQWRWQGGRAEKAHPRRFQRRATSSIA